MDDDSTRETVPHYRAFISYSHADSRLAGRLHKALESSRDADGARLAPIFIDRAELAAGPDLSAQVRAALGQSAALIVVASPAARASRWVGQEIALFRQLNPDRPVLAALVDGDPDAAFPDGLVRLGDTPVEPLAADFRKGRDGWRLGLLKLVAGLTGQPLDRLVQREAQARQRRVMAVTAGAVLLSLVLAALLVAAIRARNEAERQRAEAEGLVEFMLTDLRDRLKGVGRLDVMDAVNRRAFAYYGDQHDLAALPPDSLLRRARVIGAMGEDDENRGMPAQARSKYLELHRVTGTMLASDPDNPELIFAHAQSENRLALIENSTGDNAAARPRFKSALALLDRLPATGVRPEWRRLRSYVVGNLCAIELQVSGKPQQAVAYCRSAIALGESLMADSKPESRPALQYDLVFHFIWLGDAQAASGDKAGASQSYRKSLALSDALQQSDPANLQWREQRMEVAFQLARRAARGQFDQPARELLDVADRESAFLVQQDPANQFWRSNRIRILTLGKELPNE